MKNTTDTTNEENAFILPIQLYPKNGIWVSCEMNLAVWLERYRNIVANRGYVYAPTSTIG